MRTRTATNIARINSALSRLNNQSRKARSGQELYPAITGFLQTCLSFHPTSPVRVTFYTIDSVGMLQVSHASDLETLRGSHNRGTRLEGPLKEAVDRRGVIYAPNIRPQVWDTSILCGGEEVLSVSIVPNPRVATGYVRKYGRFFGESTRMDIAFGCLADGDRVFGAWKIDNFKAGKPLLGAGMEIEEFLAFSLLASTGASRSMAAFYDRIKLEEERDKALRFRSGADFLLREITHSVNNGLAMIGGHAELLGLQGLTVPQSGRLDRIHELVQQLKECVDSTRSAMRSGQVMTITILPTDIRSIAEVLIAPLGITVETDQDLPLANTDRMKIINIFFELIANARKYSKKGSQIKMTVQKRGSEIVVSVVDQGRGLSRREIRQIFEGDFRVDSSIEGTGWGLNTCKTIIENMGGRIWVESKGIGKGSTFSIALPIN